MDYTASIDPAFTTDQADAITAALEDWESAVPQLHITYTIASCDSPLLQNVCFHPTAAPTNPTDDVVGSTVPASSGGATVSIFVDRIAALGGDTQVLMKQTAAHEMGHALGLDHTVSGRLMAPYVAEQAHLVTPGDVAQFWAVRGQ